MTDEPLDRRAEIIFRNVSFPVQIADAHPDTAIFALGRNFKMAAGQEFTFVPVLFLLHPVEEGSIY